MESTINESDVEVIERIAAGGFAEVYRATWTSPNHGKLEVAAKKIPISSEATIEEQLQVEVDILQDMNHENVIKYYGQIVTPTHVMIITEYASKGSLKDFLRDKERLPQPLVYKWATEAARGIQYLKTKGVVHRDIKSANLLITADDTLKVCDFGIAKHLDATKTTQNRDRGTLPWLAPEVFMHGKLSPKADIYSFGIVLWELNACDVPYRDKIPQNVMFEVAMHNARPEIPHDCPEDLKALMQECWNQDRSKRPPIDEVVARLERAE